ncbi:MAG: tetratricopeptide repeat protein [Prevotella sp.]|nr:tetratricopeptide repeat protein [Prevotella sp.]
MKKIFFAALMMFATSTAFAADSDALKSILKSKNYAEAAAMLKSSLTQFASDAERAKAYNHLVQLAMEKFDKENAAELENMARVQTGKANEVVPYDTAGYYEAAYNALMDAIECDKYDNMPDAKGKVKPKFREANLPRVANARIQLVNAGQREAQQGNEEGVLKYWGAFLDTEDSDFLSTIDKSNEAGFFGQVAYFTGLYANQAKQTDRALKYLDMAMKDPEQAKDAQAQKFAISQSNLKTQADSLKFIDELKAFYAENPDNEAAFGTLCNLYSSMNKKDEVMTLIQDKITRNPNNYTAWALKGQTEMNDQKYTEAIESFKKAVDIDDTNPIVLTYLGFCMNNRAAEIEGDIPAQKALYKESMGYLEKAKSIDPDRTKANWAYPLYQCYYINYSANDPRTKELEEMLK